MWRNGPDGTKTLCNACGVRLQRQLNKVKQQQNRLQLAAAAAREPSELGGDKDALRPKTPTRRASSLVIKSRLLDQAEPSSPNEQALGPRPWSRAKRKTHSPQGLERKKSCSSQGATLIFGL